MTASEQPWYRDGLRFECTGCGDCCSGEPGYVWVNEAEIQQMADQLRVSVEQFEGQFVRQIGRQKSLIEYPGGDCIFLDPDSRRCTVYAVRPIQCRTWPFWTSNLRTRKAWRETCQVCPGSGKGRLYTLEEIEVRRREKNV